MIRAHTLAPAFAAALAAAAAAPIAHAQALWTEPLGGAWFDPNNWSTINVPDTAAESAFIGLANTFTVGLGSQSFQLDSVNIANNAATLSLGSADIVLAASPGLVNSGTIRSNQATLTGDVENTAIGTFDITRDADLDLLGPDFINNGTVRMGAGVGSSPATLNFPANVAVSGNGNFFALSGSQIRTTPAATINIAPTIDITDITLEANFVNNGTIAADTLPVSIRRPDNAAAGSFENAGDIIAEQNAFLSISAGTLTGNGTVSADDNAQAQLGPNLTINGQLTTTAGSGEIIFGFNTRIESLTNTGLLTNNTEIQLAAPGLQNNGQFNLGAPGFANTEINLTEPAAIEGNGALTMDAADITAPSTAIALTHGITHEINGDGEFEDITVINNGNIVATTGLIRFRDAQLDNNSRVNSQSGRVNFTNTAITQSPTAELLATSQPTQLFSNTSLTGGQLRASGPGRFEVFNATLNNTRNLAPVHVLSGGTLTIDASITNDGTITVGDGATSTSTVNTPAAAQLNGNGELRLASASRAQLGDGADAFTNTQAHTISGEGDIDATLINRASLSPGTTGADETTEWDISGDLTLEDTGTLTLDAEDFTFTFNRDSLDIAGTATLDGTLEVRFRNGFTPALGESAVIITATTIAGEFETLILPALPDPGTTLRVAYDTNASTVSLIATCPQDADANGAVDLPDLLTVLANFGNNTTNGPADGDLDGSGTVDLNDLLEILANFGSTCP